MKHASRKLLESAILTLHAILDEETSESSSLNANVIDVVNAVLMPNAEGYYVVTALAGERIDGFAISRRPSASPGCSASHSDAAATL